MGKYYIPYNIPEIIEPKFFGTNIPNLLGRAIIIYDNGMRGYIDLYYIQKFVKCVIRLIFYLIILLKIQFCKKCYKKTCSFIIN